MENSRELQRSQAVFFPQTPRLVAYEEDRESQQNDEGQQCSGSLLQVVRRQFVNGDPSDRQLDIQTGGDGDHL
jgi:hypothetical protein